MKSSVTVAKAAEQTIVPADLVFSPDSTDSTKQNSKLSHQQDVWISALEWCESSGTSAVNEHDLDGTPSYFYFQFKPDTFKEYATQYGVLLPGSDNTVLITALQSYYLQHEVVEQMVLDSSISYDKWANELFPGCIKKIGYPPRS